MHKSIVAQRLSNSTEGEQERVTECFLEEGMLHIGQFVRQEQMNETIKRNILYKVTEG